jgi:hypothetical protein
MHRNYSCAIVGFVLIFASVLWFIYARKHYKGPIYTPALLALIEGHAFEDNEAVSADAPSHEKIEIQDDKRLA